MGNIRDVLTAESFGRKEDGSGITCDCPINSDVLLDDIEKYCITKLDKVQAQWRIIDSCVPFRYEYIIESYPETHHIEEEE